MAEITKLRTELNDMYSSIIRGEKVDMNEYQNKLSQLFRMEEVFKRDSSMFGKEPPQI